MKRKRKTVKQKKRSGIMQESNCSRAKSEYRYQHKHGYISSDITNDKNEVIKYQKKKYGKCESLNMYSYFFQILLSKFSYFCDVYGIIICKHDLT